MYADTTAESLMKLKRMCFAAGVLILLPISVATAQIRPLTGTSIFQSAGYGAYPLSLAGDPKICLTRTSNGKRECRTRDEWTRISHKLSQHQQGS